MRTIRVTYADGEVVEGKQIPFDQVLWERHFKMPAAKLAMEMQANTAKHAADDDPERAAFAEVAYVEYDLFYAYLMCKRQRKHRDCSFDEWGEQIEKAENVYEDEVDADPLDGSVNSGGEASSSS